MKCFVHQDRDAVGICKNCQKGLCIECAVEVENGISCQGKSQQENAANNLTIIKNRTLSQKTAAAHKINALVYLLIGIICLVTGIYWCDMTSLWLLPCGAVMLIGAILSYRAANKYISNK